MMRCKYYLLFLLLAISCKKEPQDELSKLPAATQIGANTFGCLINGVVWTSARECAIFCDPSVTASYDPTDGGFLWINATWHSGEIDQNIAFSMDSTNFKRNHILTIEKRMTTARYINYTNLNPCSKYERFDDSVTVHSGTINITKYDFINGIIAGTFRIKLTKPGCATLNITDGRFDVKMF